VGRYGFCAGIVKTNDPAIYADKTLPTNNLQPRSRQNTLSPYRLRRLVNWVDDSGFSGAGKSDGYGSGSENVSRSLKYVRKRPPRRLPDTAEFRRLRTSNACLRPLSTGRFWRHPGTDPFVRDVLRGQAGFPQDSRPTTTFDRDDAAHQTELVTSSPSSQVSGSGSAASPEMLAEVAVAKCQSFIVLPQFKKALGGLAVQVLAGRGIRRMCSFARDCQATSREFCMSCAGRRK
jgi:hypothetical protein